jgi:hypothetical protein
MRVTVRAGASYARADRVETPIDGRPWVQNPLPYQRQCVGCVQVSHARLGSSDRSRLNEILEGTGCESLFE